MKNVPQPLCTREQMLAPICVCRTAELEHKRKEMDTTKLLGNVILFQRFYCIPSDKQDLTVRLFAYLHICTSEILCKA